MPYIFDVYGTLLDVDAAARAAAREPGMERLADCWPDLAAAWRTRQLSYSWLRTTMQRYTDFWTITQNALDVTLRDMGLDHDPALRDRLLALYTTLDAYPEVPAALETLAARGGGLGVLSNGAPPMLDAALAAAGIAGHFDHLLSVDSLRLYKPDPAVYRLVIDAYDCQPGDVLFFSSNNWDVAGAAAFGFEAVWINRAGKIWDDLPGQPAHIAPDITAALALIS